ncbi:MAG: hypothetical protein AAFV59_15885, partial [Pseudomonadota bacterium]
KWKKGATDLDRVFEILNEGRRQGKDEVAFENLFLDQYTSVLASNIEFPIELSAHKAQRLVHAACFARTQDGNLTAKNYISELRRRCNSVLESVVRRDCIFYLSTYGEPPFASFKSLDGSLQFKFNNSRYCENQEAMQIFEGDNFSEFQKYTPVLIGVESDSVGGCIEKAYDSLNFVRGIWNLTSPNPWRLTISQRIPKRVNLINLRPSYSVHDTNGSLDEYGVRHLPYFGQVDPMFNMNSRVNLKSDTAKMLRKIRAHPMRLDLEKSILRYVEAFDNVMMGSCFLAGWSLLEFLTGSDFKDNKTAARRAARFFYADEDLALEVAEHLRFRRNNMVHQGASYFDDETLAYQVKMFIEELMLFLILDKKKFASREEFGEYLDLPGSSSSLHSILKDLKREEQKLRRSKALINDRLSRRSRPN